MVDDTQTSADGPTLVDLATIIVRGRRLVLWTASLLGTLVAIASLVASARYTAYALFVPQSTAGPSSRVAGLAAQFGVAIPTSEAGNSPEFYADLLASMGLLKDVVAAPLVVGDDSTALDLPAWLGIGEVDSARRVSDAAEELRHHLEVSVRPQTGVVRVEVTTRDPAVSSAVVNAAVALLNRFNVDVRQTQASQERRFLAERLTAIQAELRTAEDSLQQFLEANRDFASSPHLRFNHARLERVVSLKQDLYGTASQAFEQAQADAVRNTPVITIVAAPAPPVVPDPRYVLVKVTLALCVGLVVGIFIALARELWRRSARADPERMAGLVDAVQEATPRWRRKVRDARG